MNGKQLALIRKDVRSITANKRVLLVMLVVPLALAVVLPSVFIVEVLLDPSSASDFQPLLDMLPGSGDASQQVPQLLLNKIMPSFFLMIPLMASSVMAASAFVGEKEKHTLETLLYSPLSLKQVFQAKILAVFIVGMMVALLSFAAMLLAVECETMLLAGFFLVPDISWLIVMLLVTPAISLAGIAVTVQASARAQTTEEAQQSAVFLIFPLLGLVIGQFGGVLLVNAWLLLGLGLALAALDLLLMRKAAGKFTYERLLRQ